MASQKTEQRAPAATHQLKVEMSAGHSAQAVQAAMQTKPAAQTARSDRYRIKGPGSIFRGYRLLPPGTIVTLSESDALSVMDNLEPV